jgi:hypothetical protein
MAGFTTSTVDETVIDGGTSYVGLENDLSGNCDGDSGRVTVDQLQLPRRLRPFRRGLGLL